MTTKVEKKQSEFHSFYGGRMTIEQKPWGDHFRFIKNGEKGSTLSATGITKYLDKSRALIPWAVGLVGTHITSFFQSSKGEQFTKDEIFLVVSEAILKPEEKKVQGGASGDLIHDYAHNFAKAVIAGTDLPTLDHLDEEDEVQTKALNGINAFLDWYNENDVEFIAMEKVVYYNSLLAGDSKEGEEVIEYIGIMDLFAKVNGVYKVVDYKTSKGVYSDQRYQVSGYLKAWNSDSGNTKADGTLILNFGKETGDLIKKDIPLDEAEKDFKAFKGLHAVALREKELDAEYLESKKVK